MSTEPTELTESTEPSGRSDALQVVVMGVSGTGKSTVAQRLADRTGWGFVEGDDLHPPRNIAKMESGQPLTDEDRGPWLAEINLRARARTADGHSTLITCSALKRDYRARLQAGVPQMFFLHLAADYGVLEPRMQRRERHFMPTGMLRSQFDTLEPLAADEDGAVVDVSGTIDEVVAAAYDALERRLPNQPL